MAKFIAGLDLNREVQRIVENATEELILISPLIRLHHLLISELKRKTADPNLALTVVFGKNEFEKWKSLGESDFEFFKSFPNVQIKYSKNLHAKYYANESTAILSSMNLYDYSQNNNIEAGVLIKTSILKDIANNVVSNITGNESLSLDAESTRFFNRMMEEAEIVFDKEPEFDSQLFGLSKKYIRSVIVTDKLSDLFNQRRSQLPNELQNSDYTHGFCIRTGKPIPFNVRHPMSDEAFENWQKSKHKDLKENYCHFSGEPAYNHTSFAKPILPKNWHKAKEIHKF